MHMTRLSSRTFNQDVSKAKRLAGKGPVLITDRGKPAHVLLNVGEYERLTQQAANIVDLLALPDANGQGLDFTAPRLQQALYQPADFT